MTDLFPVTPAKPVAAYIGGKRNLAARIASVIGNIPHDCYAEPFVGMGGVFFRRRHRPKSEVINDASRDVATLFRVLQRHQAALVDVMRLQVTSRAEFDRLMAVDPCTLTDLERASRFVYLQRLSFGGKVKGRTFGVDPSGGARFNVATLAPMLEAVHHRLAGCVIECLDFEPFIHRYDRPKTLFYVDSPYVGSEDYYGGGLFRPSDLGRLAEALKSIKGRFVASNIDCPEVRAAFADCEMREVETLYTTGTAGKNKHQQELIIIGP